MFCTVAITTPPMTDIANQPWPMTPPGSAVPTIPRSLLWRTGTHWILLMWEFCDTKSNYHLCHHSGHPCWWGGHDDRHFREEEPAVRNIPSLARSHSQGAERIQQDAPVCLPSEPVASFLSLSSITVKCVRIERGWRCLCVCCLRSPARTCRRACFIFAGCHSALPHT